MPPCEAAVGHAISLGAKLSHDCIAAVCNRDDRVRSAVGDQHMRLPDTFGRQKPAAREHDDRAEADRDPSSIDAATGEGHRKRSVDKANVPRLKAPAVSCRRGSDDHQAGKVPRAVECPQATGGSTAACAVKCEEECACSGWARPRHPHQGSPAGRDVELVLPMGTHRSRLCGACIQLRRSRARCLSPGMVLSCASRLEQGCHYQDGPGTTGMRKPRRGEGSSQEHAGHRQAACRVRRKGNDVTRGDGVGGGGRKL